MNSTRSHRTLSCATLRGLSISTHAPLRRPELYRNLAPDGKSIMHAELMLGDSRFLLHDEFPEQGLLSPLAYPGTAVTLHLYVADVNGVFASAWKRAPWY